MSDILNSIVKVSLTNTLTLGSITKSMGLGCISAAFLYASHQFTFMCYKRLRSFCGYRGHMTEDFTAATLIVAGLIAASLGHVI